MPLEARDVEQLQQWQARSSRQHTLDVLLTEDRRSRDLAAFCEALQHQAPRISVRSRKTGGNGQPPAIEIRAHVRYHAVPTGPELAPFLEAVEPSTAGRHRLEGAAAIRTPAFLRLFIATGCPHCPRVVSQVLALARAADTVDLTVIDGLLFDEIARAEGIHSTPTLVADGGWRWTGALDLAELGRFLAGRDPAAISARTLENMLKAGDAARAARLMLAERQIFPALFDLLGHPQWSVRLGAMVVVEEIAAAAPSLAADVVDPLWERFDALDPQAMGDVLYLFGEAGEPTAADKLNAVLQGAYGDEVKAAAQEALQSLATRHGQPARG